MHGIKYIYCMHNDLMNITHDPVKNQANRRKHGIELAEDEGVFYDSHAITVEDCDHDE